MTTKNKTSGWSRPAGWDGISDNNWLEKTGAAVFHHLTDTPDPWIQGRTIQVFYLDGKEEKSYHTQINASRQHIIEYFSQGPMNVGNVKDKIVRMTGVYFLPVQDHPGIFADFRCATLSIAR